MNDTITILRVYYPINVISLVLYIFSCFSCSFKYGAIIKLMLTCDSAAGTNFTFNIYGHLTTTIVDELKISNIMIFIIDSN